jgi:DNA repair protein RecO (recombination protein O)
MTEGEGIVISLKEYSNSSLIVQFLTPEGKLSGFLKGGLKRKDRISPFSTIKFKLNKRLEEHLGVLNLEVIKSPSYSVMKDKTKLIILCSIQEILTFSLQEGGDEKDLYLEIITLLNLLKIEEREQKVVESYLKFELKMLSIFGFGLDFSECAISGKKDVFFISPHTGKCASFEAGRQYIGSIFEIPFIYGNLKNSHLSVSEDFKNAFKINTHFLKNVPNHHKLTSREKLHPFKISSNLLYYKTQKKP